MVNIGSIFRQSNWIIRWIYRDVRKHKLRNLIGIVSIALSIGLLIAMNATVDTIGNTYVDFILNSTPDYDFEINPVKKEYISNYSTISPKIMKLEKVRSVVPRYITQATMIISFQVEEERQDVFYLPSTIIGLNISKENEMGIGTFDPPTTESLGTNKCLLIGDFGRNIKTVLNQNLSVNYFYIRILNPVTNEIIESRLEISGVVEEDQKLPIGFNIVVLDLNLIETWFGEKEICTQLIGKFSDQIYSVKDPEGSVNAAKEIAITIQSNIGMEDYSVTIPKAQAIESADFTGIRLMLNFIGILILILATILIYSLNTVSIREKTREYAMLRTLGINDRKILLILFVSQLFGTVWGIFVGILFGFILSSFITNMLFSNIENFTLIITTETIIFSCIIGGLAGLLSAIKPSLDILNRNIVVSLEYGRSYTQEYSITRERHVSKTMGLLGLGLASLGSVFFIILPLLDFLGDPLLSLTLFLFLLLSFLIGCVILVVGVLSPILEKILVNIFLMLKRTKKIGILTKTFLLKNQRRNSLTSVIFALSLAFILYLSMSSTFNAYLSTENLRHYYGSDIVVQSSGIRSDFVEPAVISALRKNDNVSFVSFVSSGNIAQLIGCQAVIGDMALFNAITPSNIYGIANRYFAKSLFSSPHIQEGEKDAWQQLEENNTIIISRSIAAQLEKGIGDFLRLKVSSPIRKNNELYRKNLNLTIVGVADRIGGFQDVHTAKKYSGYSAVFCGNKTWNSIVLNKEANLTNQITINSTIDRIFVKCKSSDPEVIDDVQTDVFLEFGTSVQAIRIDILLDRLNESLETQREQLSVILSLSLIIAFFSIFSSTQTSIIEALREIAIIKAIGLKERELTIVFICQAIIITLVSTILGGFVGYGLAFLTFVQNALQMEFPIVLVPPDSIVYNIYGAALFFSVLGTYIPVRSLKNKEPTQMLRSL
ncbi:MAG: FtsX-like permease family protein [Candidatus Thorarchaeota archaeon]